MIPKFSASISFPFSGFNSELTIQIMKYFIGLVSAYFWVLPTLLAVEVKPIGELLKNADKYRNEYVSVEGRVVDIEEAKHGKKHRFYLADKDDKKLRIHILEDLPELNRRYRAEGVLYEDKDELFIHAEQLECINCPQEKEESDDSQDWIIGLLVGLLVLAFVLVWVLWRSQKSVGMRANPRSSFSGAASSAGSPPSNQQATVSFNMEEIAQKMAPKAKEPSTTAMPRGSATEVDQNQGFVEVIAGGEAGRSIPLREIGDTDASAVMIGRKSKAMEAHEGAKIMLNDPTVSRQQALFRFREGQLYLCNLSATNPSSVDGRVLAVNEEHVVASESVLKMGDIKLKYKK